MISFVYKLARNPYVLYLIETGETKMFYTKSSLAHFDELTIYFSTPK